MISGTKEDPKAKAWMLFYTVANNASKCGGQHTATTMSWNGFSVAIPLSASPRSLRFGALPPFSGPVFIFKLLCCAAASTPILLQELKGDPEGEEGPVVQGGASWFLVKIPSLLTLISIPASCQDWADHTLLSCFLALCPCTFESVSDGWQKQDRNPESTSLHCTLSRVTQKKQKRNMGARMFWRMFYFFVIMLINSKRVPLKFLAAAQTSSIQLLSHPTNQAFHADYI